MCRGTEDKMLSLGLLQGRVCWGSRKRPQVQGPVPAVGGIGVCRDSSQPEPISGPRWWRRRAQFDRALHSEPGAQPALGTTCWGHTERCPWIWVQLLQAPPLNPPNLPPSPASTPAASTPRLRSCGEVWMASDNLGFISVFSQLDGLGLVAALSWICHL